MSKVDARMLVSTFSLFETNSCEICIMSTSAANTRNHVVANALYHVFKNSSTGICLIAG